MTEEKDKGGCPTLAEQAENHADKGETRIDLAMAKAIPKVLKHFQSMVDNLDKQKDTIQMKIMDTVLNHNKANRKAKREMLQAMIDDMDKPQDDEDYSIELDLTSAPVDNKSLN